jgi:hypothetical protein
VVALAGVFRAPFVRYWLSGFLADFGDGVRLAAFPLLASQLTRSPTAVAAVMAVQSLPWLLGGAGLGVLVDRSDRRRLMVIVDVTRAVIIAGLAVAVLTHSAGLALIYVTAFVTGVGSALRDTAAVTCVPRLVDSASLDSANARMIAGQIVGNELAGLAAGGWLFGVAAVLPFAVNAGTLGVAVLLLQSPGTYGLLLAIGAVGGISIGGTGPRIARRLGSWRSLFLAGLVMAVTLAVLGLTDDVIIAAVMLAASSAAWALFNMTAVTMRQRQVPGQLLGRVTSLYGTVFRGCEALGALGGGVVAAIAGIRATMLIGALPIAAAMSLLAWRHRSSSTD